MKTFAIRILASVLAGLLSTSCGTLREARQPDAEEAFFLPRASRAVASPVVDELELKRALDEFLPQVNVEAVRAELRRLVADPRFHGRRPDGLRVVLASWGSGPAALEEITRGYRAWCAQARRPDCLTRQLTDSDVYEVAFDFAMGAQWDGFIRELKSTIEPSTIRLVLLAGLVIFMASIAVPELFSKIPAAIATAILTAYIGARAVCDLVFGWIHMVAELDDAATFDQVRAAGERYGRVVGTQTARVLVLLATAAIAQGGIVARLMKLPRVSQASAALAIETGGVGLEAVGASTGARVVQSGVAITVQGAAQGAVGFAMAAHGGSPGAGSGGASMPPTGGTASPGVRPFTAANFRTNLARLTGGIPKGADAHHVFPQQFDVKFKAAGINIHDPRFGAWWETTAHQRAAFKYNAEWDRFLRPSRSAEEILQFGRELSARHGLSIGF